jgi:hypothetical protein
MNHTCNGHAARSLSPLETVSRGHQVSTAEGIGELPEAIGRLKKWPCRNVTPSSARCWTFLVDASAAAQRRPHALSGRIGTRHACVIQVTEDCTP